MQIVSYKSREIMALSLAALVAGQLATALKNNGRATLAVPGGTTPGPFLKALSQAKIDWHLVSVLLTDERMVPITDPRSNTKLLKETLLQGPAAKAKIIPMAEIDTSPQGLVERLEPAISAALPIDVCVLGMGADMHVASLFPKGDNLGLALDISAPPLMAMRATNAPEPRLTLTAPALNSALKTHILITGVEKKRALEQAQQSGSDLTAPVRAILFGPSEVSVHYAD